MGSYSEWITSKRNLYKTAVTNAYTAHQGSSGNDYESAYDSMAAVSEIAALIPPTNNTAFYGSSPNATEAQINTLQTWLQANPAVAGKLNLLNDSDASDASGRKALGVSGNVGTEKRKWKGNPLYTFANGVVVGKNNKLIAGIGTDGGTSIDGFGTDTLVYFDGIPFSKGTGLPGTAVFAGDLVVSGSIQGNEGVVIIDDVIQLERGVFNPAGIGVDDSGKIRLRHRGEGFLDLVDEVEKAKSGSIEDAKLWVGAQNTSAARWGSSLIPNSNFAQIENSGSGGSYAERPAGVISVGSTSNIMTYSGGIVTINPNGKGIAFQAIPLTADRYTVRIRFKGASALTPATQGTAEGLFIGFHETTVEDLGSKLYVYDGSEFSTDVESTKSSDVHTSSVSVKYATGNRSTDGSTYDGSPITTGYVVKSYTYSPSSNAKNASLVIHARNYNHNLDIDYIVMTETPQTSTEITSLINAATSAITGETGSELGPQAVMTDKSLWAAIGGASLTDSPNGGDSETTGDAAIEVACGSSGDGIASTSIDCQSDTYLVGIRIKTTSGSTNISIAGVETAGPYFGSLGGSDPKLIPGDSDYRTKSITLQEIDSEGQPTGSASATKSVSTSWKTLIGTYEPNKLHPVSYATGYTTPTNSVGNTYVLPGKFSLAIRADSSVTFVLDYVYASVQGSSVNVAQELANSAYGDSQTFVTQINDLLIKESGSIVQNSSMALPSTSSNGPAGYRARGTGATIATVGTGAQNKSVKVTSTSSGNLTLISPPFNLGESDKFSIGVRIKSLESGAVSAKVDVAYSADDVPTDKVTLANSGPADVYVTNTTEVPVTIDDNSDTGGGSLSSNQYDISVGTSYQSILATWDRKAADGTYAKKNASIVITCDGDFEVDYILVKEQICSFDLADTQAQTRRDEAIAQAESFTTALGEAVSAESGSMVQNASFSSWYLNASNKHRPQGWFTTRGASNPLRVIPATESTDATTQAKENVENVNQQGSAIKFTPSTSGGILSRFIQLPAGSTWTNPADSSETTTTGTYTFAVKIRLSSAEPVGVRLYAHEYYSFVDGAQTHVWCTNGTYGSATYEDSGTPNPKIKTFTDGTSGSDTTGRVSRIGPINLTTNDTMPGYNPGGGDYSASGDDQYVEYIPVDNSETDGDIDNTASNYATWYTISGTYTPHASTKQVSFEILIDGDPDSSDGNIPNVYIDYVNLVPQPFDTDFAQAIAEARTQSLTGITSDGTFGDGSRLLAASILDARSRLATTEAALAAESPDSSLLPNSFFTEYTGSSLPATPTKWVGTRDTGATVTLKTAAYDSYNTYVELGSDSASEEVHGMLSKAVAIVGDGATNFGICGGGLNPTFTSDPNDGTATTTTYPTFDLVCRFRGLTTPTNVITTGTEHLPNSSTNAQGPNSSYEFDDEPTIVTNGLGNTLTFTTATTHRYDISGATSQNRQATWNIPWSANGHGSAANVTELIIGFRYYDWDAHKDPKLQFLTSGSSGQQVSGVYQIWDTSGNLLQETSIANKHTITNWEAGDDSAHPTNATLASAGESSDAQARWVVIKLSSGLSALHSIKFTSQDSSNYDNAYVNHMNFFSYVHPSPEQISLSMYAHELDDVALDTNIEHVYANGVNYTLDSSATAVQRFYTGGSGRVKTVQTILSTGDTSIKDETSVTSNAWQTLIGQYTPTSTARWVSFEFVINEDKDNDDVRPTVLIDGILLQQSDGSSLAQAAKTSATAAQATANSNSSSITTINTTVGAIQTSVALMKAADDELFLINTAIANEQSSLIQNAGFMNTTSSTTTDSESNTVTNMALPASFLPFKRTGAMVRVQNTDSSKTGLASITHTGTPNSIPSSVQSPYYDFGQNEFCMVVPSINDTDQDVIGFYTSAIVIPNRSGAGTSSGSSSSDTHSNDFSTAVTMDSGGAYSIAFKIKNLDNRTTNEDITVSIYAHEYDDGIGPATDGKFIIDPGSSADWDGFDYNSSIATEIGKSTVNQHAGRGKQLITIVKLSDQNDTSFGSSEDIDESANPAWITVGGTYTATSTAECVSFSLHIDVDKANDNDIAGLSTVSMGTLDNGSGGAATLNPVVAVDFVYCGTQSFTASMAEQIVASRVETVQTTLNTDLTTLEDNLGAESDSLMPNGNFAQKFTASSVDYVKNWLPTGNGSADKLRLYAADSASKSIGTYIKFNKNASGGSAPYGNNKSGIISKAILNPVEIVRDLDGNINSFNIGMRIRGTTDEVAASITGPTSSTNTTTDDTFGSNAAYNADVNSSARFNHDGLDYSFTSLGDNYALRSAGESTNTMGEYHRIPNPVADPNSSGYTKQWVLFYVAHTSPDSSWQLYIRPSAGTSKLSTVNATKAYISNDNGLNWTSKTVTSGQYISSNSSTISTAISTNASLVMVQFEHSTPGTLLPSDFDYVQVFANASGPSGYFWMGRQSRWFSSTSATVPDFTVKLIAHETYEAVADPNVVIRGPLVNMDSTSIPTGVGVTVPAAFSTGASTAQNLIDLRYSGSSASTEITIDASAVNDDTGEDITDWRHIVGSYTPNEATTAVSFEILIDHEPDDISPVQEVWLDSITMAVSSVGTDLAQTIADNRVFVEQNFEGGSTPVSPNNVITNADMSKVFLDGTTKRPQNWAYWSTATISGGYDNIFVSPDSTTTNRAITFKKGTTYGTNYGIISRPFRITGEKYKLRIVYNVATGSSTASGNMYMGISAMTHDSELSDAADSIVASGMNLHPTSTAYITGAGVNSSYTNQIISNIQRSFSGTKTTIELTWTPITQTSSTRPNAADLPLYASIRLGLHSSGDAFDINIWEISAVPEGGQYPSYQFGSAETKAYGTDFDDDGDVLPDAPRETEAKEPLYQSIDIQVSDTTQASPPKNRLLMALPRKYFPDNTSFDPAGTSYLYPGVSDLEYKQVISSLFALLGTGDLSKAIGESRHLKFVSGMYNTIQNVTHIKMTDFVPGASSEIQKGFHADQSGGDRTIDGIGMLDFDPNYNPTGYFGNVGQSPHGYRAIDNQTQTYHASEIYINGIGPCIRGPHTLYLGPNWGDWYNGSAYGKAAFGMDAVITNRNGQGTRNGKGTTIGNGYSSSGTVTYNDNKYNRMGGIYLKQKHDKHGMHFIDYNSEARSIIGYNGNNLAFFYAANEDTALTEIGYLSNSTDVNQITFTGQHRNYSEEITNEDVGLIVVSTGIYKNVSTNTIQQKPSINEALPIVKLSDRRNQKACFGVVSNVEDPNDEVRTYQEGRFVSTFPKEEGDERLIINSLGEGGIWICNINGNLENGDYITTCEIPGYGMLQDDDLLHNYTVAKITQDCNFELDNPLYDCVEFEFEGNTYRKAFVGCTYHCG